MYTTIFICLFLLILSLICSKNNIFAPAVITSGIWLIVLLLYTFMNHKLNPLTDKFLDSMNLWIILFCLSALTIQSFKMRKIQDTKPSTLNRNIFFYLSLATFPFLIYKAYVIINIGGSSNWLNTLRSATVGGLSGVNAEETNPFYTLIWLVSYFLELQILSKENRKRTLILFFFYFTYCLFTVSKTNFLTLFLGSIFILYNNGIFKLKHLLRASLVLVLIFSAIQLGRMNDKSKSDFTITKSVSLYLLSPAPAFETIKPNSTGDFGENVFRFYYAIKYKLGDTNHKPVETILPFVNVGVGTNTYTVLYPFYKDFAKIGIIIFSIFMGGFYGYIFIKSQSGNTVFIILYASFIFQIAMQFANEMFFTYLSLNIKILIISSMPFFISKYSLFFIKNKNE